MKPQPIFKSSWVSLDVQPHELRLIIIHKYREKYIIEQALSLPCAERIFAEGLIKRFDVLSTLLAEQVSHYGLTGTSAIIQLPAKAVRMEKLTMAKGLSLTAMEAFICNYVQRDLPQRNEDLAIDFTTVGKVNDELIEVSFAATRKDYITNLNDCLRTAGLRLKVVDIDVHCLKRLMPAEKNISACLHLSKQLATLVVCQDKEMLFHQQWRALATQSILNDLPYQLELCYAALGIKRIGKWFICADEEYQQQIIREKFFKENELCVLSLSNLFALSTTLEKTFLSASPVDFAFACGALMRVVPVW